MKTVLVTSIGSLSAEAVFWSLRHQSEYRILGCDTNPSTWLAISSATDRFFQITPSQNSSKYLQELEAICGDENVDYLIALTDPEVDVLSMPIANRLRSRVTVCLTDPEEVEICRNKRKLYDFFKSDSIVNVIPTFTVDEVFQKNVDCPIVAKPIRGRSSNGLYRISKMQELCCIEDRSNYIVQPMYDGSIFTVDYVRNRNSGNDFAVPRKELTRTSNGAGLSVEIVRNPVLTATASYIGNQLDINGCINMEFIAREDCYYLMDINPRFSAGVVFSRLAGYDMVASHMNCFAGRDIIPQSSYESLTITRKYVEVITQRS